MNNTKVKHTVIPAMLTLLLFLISATLHSVNKIDEKLFLHLTNDSIHTPKEYVISRAEFAIFREYHSEEYKTIIRKLEKFEEVLYKK